MITNVNEVQQIWSDLAKCERLKEFTLKIFHKDWGFYPSAFSTTTSPIKGDEHVKLPSVEYFHITSMICHLDYDSIFSMLDKEKLKGLQICTSKDAKAIDSKSLFAKLQDFTNLRCLYLEFIPIGEIDQSVYEAIRNYLLKSRHLQYLRLILQITKCVDSIIISTQLMEILRRKRKLKAARIVAQVRGDCGHRERLDIAYERDDRNAAIINDSWCKIERIELKHRS